MLTQPMPQPVKVKDLVAALSKLPPNAEIVIDKEGFSYWMHNITHYPSSNTVELEI